MADIGDWFRSVPFFTRYWFASTLGLSLLGRFVIYSGYLILTYDDFINRFQCWRAITALFYYPINSQTGFHFLLNLYFLVTYSSLLETGTFSSSPADYAFLLLVTFVLAVISALMMKIMVLMDIAVLAVLYIWCQLNKDTIVNFWFGTQFRALYLPWVLLGFNMIISGGGVVEIIGILVGHAYFFLKFQYPQQYNGGESFLRTPKFLEAWFPSRRTSTSTQGTTYRWGRGHSLGSR